MFGSILRSREDAPVAIVRVFCLHFTLSLCNDKTKQPRADEPIHRDFSSATFTRDCELEDRSSFVPACGALAKFLPRALCAICWPTFSTKPPRHFFTLVRNFFRNSARIFPLNFVHFFPPPLPPISSTMKDLVVKSWWKKNK